MKQSLVIKIKRYTVIKLFFLISICFFLSWTTTSSNSEYLFSKKPIDYYNLQTEAFLNKQTALLTLPDPRLLALKNPYDPIANAPYRFHDLSLYKNKYYLYFGITPVVTLLLPFRLITGNYLPVNLATLLFIIAGSYYCVKLLLRIKKSLYLENSVSDEFILWLLFTFCTGAPLLLRWANIYELAVSSAACFAISGFYYLNESLINNSKVLAKLTLSSFLFGLSIASRPNLIFLISITVGFYFLRFSCDQFKSNNKLYIPSILNKKNLCLITPLILVLFSIFAYNYIRFDNFLEFGHRYQLSGEIKDPGIKESNVPLHLSNIASHLHHYLTQKISVTNHFPFLTYDTSVPVDYKTHEFSVEPTFGLFTINPIYILSFLSIYFFLPRKNTQTNIIFFLSISSITNLLVSCSFSGTTARYMMDFAPYLLICAVATYYLIFNYFRKKIVINTLRTLLIIFTLSGSLTILLLSFSGYGDRSLQYQDFTTFSKLADLFGDKAEQIKPVRFVNITGEFKIASKPQDEQSQILLSSGHKGSSDCVLINYHNSKVRFGFTKYIDLSSTDYYLSPFDVTNATYSITTYERLYGPYIDIDTKKIHTFEFTYNQMTSRMSLKIDGATYYEITNPMLPSSSNGFIAGSVLNDNHIKYANFNGYISVKTASVYFSEPGPWYPRL